MKDQRQRMYLAKVEEVGDASKISKKSALPNYNPKYYANDQNLLPSPIAFELLSQAYTNYGELGIFILYALLDMSTNLLL